MSGSDGGNTDGERENRESDDMAPEELERARMGMLQEIERRMEEHDCGSRLVMNQDSESGLGSTLSG